MSYRFTVAGGNPFAYYTRWISRKDGWPSEAEDLTCPKCGDDRIVIVSAIDSDAGGMLGDTARCWTCKREFVITGGCWKFRRIYHG